MFFLFTSCNHSRASIVNTYMATSNRVRRSVATPGSATHLLLPLEAPYAIHVCIISLAKLATVPVIIWSRRSGPVLITPVRTLQAHASIHLDLYINRMLPSSLPQCALSLLRLDAHNACIHLRFHRLWRPSVAHSLVNVFMHCVCISSVPHGLRRAS